MEQFSNERTPLLEPVGQPAVRVEPEANDGKATDTSKHKPGFNFLFLCRFVRVLAVAVPKLVSKSSLLLLLLLTVRAAEEYNYYLAGLIPSQFYLALTGKDAGLFKEALWRTAIIVTAVCICNSGGEFVAGLLYLRWRAVITRHLHTHYFSGINYYLLNIIDHKTDNPDQRIAQDVDRFCNQMSQTLPKLILQPFIIAYYSYKTFTGLGWYGVLGIYGFFIVFTFINKFVMGPIVALIFTQEKMEGNFRFHHMQIRASAESVAFYKAGVLEREKCDWLLKILLQTQLGVVHWQFPLNFLVAMFDYLSTIISYALIGVAVFSGHYDSLTPSQLTSTISQNSFFAMYLLNNFSKVIDTATSFTDIAGYTHRIGELLEALKTLNRVERGQGDSQQGGTGSASSSYGSHDDTSERVPAVPSQSLDVAAVFNDLSVAPPGTHDPLVEGLQFCFEKGKNILILGETGSGKSSILRVLAKLWKPLSGSAALTSDGTHHFIMFLPQRPYLTHGSLADQVAFPERPKRLCKANVNQAEILCQNRITEALQLAGLVYLRDRLGGLDTPVDHNWYDIISPGEMQKIGFARLFFHKPPFAILDEASCSVSEEAEGRLYNTLQLLGVTVMSVGHRSTLKKCHHQLLTIAPDHSWRLTALDSESGNPSEC